MSCIITSRLTYKDWLHSLVPPVLVVGNSVLTGPIPEHEYASVVRFNNYVLGGDSGNKVTHWVSNGYSDVFSRPVLPVLIPWSLIMEVKRGHSAKIFRDRVGKQNVLYLADDRHISHRFPVAVMRGNGFPTTGFCFLAWLLFRKIRPDIVGFDGLKTGHQDNPAHIHGHANTKELEWAIVLQWGLRHR